MGLGEKYFQQSLGTFRGEALGIQEHARAMIPIQEAQAAAELAIRKQVFEQEISQAEKWGLLTQKLEGRGTQQPVYITQEAAPAQAGQVTQPNYKVLAILILVVLYLRKGKLL